MFGYDPHRMNRKVIKEGFFDIEVWFRCNWKKTMKLERSLYIKVN